MTRPPDDPPREPDETPEEHPSSAAEQVREIAEEIRHEIEEVVEEVVEHVPKPVRWTVSRIVQVTLLALLALIVIGIASAALYVANRTEWVAQEITLVINQTLARRSNLVLDIADLRGNPFTGVRVVRPRLRFRDGRGAPLLAADEMTLRYDPWSLVAGGEHPIAIEMHDAEIRIERGPDGRLRLPTWRGERRLGKPATRRFDLTVRNARILAPAPIGRVQSLDLEVSAETGTTTHVQVRRLAWKHGPWGSQLKSLKADATFGDSARVVLSELDSPDLGLTARAAWAKNSKVRIVAVDVAHVRWAWLARVFDNGALDVPGEGHAHGNLVHDGAWRGTFAGGGTWDSLAVDGTGRLQEIPPGRWEVTALDAKSPAGSFRGRFDYDHRGWAVRGAVEHGDPSQWDALKLPGWPAGNLLGRFTYAVDTQRRRGRLDATLGTSELAGWRADSAEVIVDSPGPGTVAFGVRMKRRGGTVLLDGHTAPGGWAGTWEAREFPLDEWPDGRASGIHGVLGAGAGTVRNDSTGLFVTGALSGRASEWLGARMGTWKLDGVHGRLLPTPDLEAAVTLQNLMFLGLHFDSCGIGLALGDRVAKLLPARAVAGDTVVVVEGESRWDKGGWTARFDRASLTSRQFDWTAEPPLELSGDPHGVSFDRLVAHDLAARVAIEGRWAGPGGTYDWTATGERLDLSRLGLPPELGLGGTASARLHVNGVSGDPRWYFESRVRDPGWGGHRADSLHVDLNGSRGFLALRDFGFRLGEGAITARGRVSDMRVPWPDTLTPPRVIAWLATGASWSAEAEAHGIAIDGLERLAPAAKGWTGTLGGKLSLAGSPSRPEFTLELDGSPLAWSDYRTERVSAHAEYRNEMLEVKDLRMTTGPVTSTVSGRLPVVLALGAKPETPEREMHWELRAPRGDLSIVPAFVPQIGGAAGSFQLQATVAGTVRHPKLDGFFKVRDGVVRLAAREEVLDKVYADFRLSESRVTLDTLSARQGDRGRVRGHGVVELEGSALHGYRFDLQLHEFTTSEAGLYAAEIDGNFVVVNGPKVRGQALPQVTGDVDVRRASILFDFTRQSETQLLASTTQPLFWTYRIQVNANDNLKWAPPDADIEFNADLTIEQTRDSLIMFGEMHSLRGTYWFLSNRFQVQKADLTFDNLNGVNPQIDAEATARVTGSSTRGFDLQTESTHTVTVTITGRAKEPEVAFASDPPDWDEAVILRELTLGRLYDNGAFSPGDPLDSYLTQAINRTLSAELSRTFKGYLNDWRLDREHGGLLMGTGGYIVSVSSQPVRNVNLRYRQNLATGRNAEGYTAAEDPFERSVEAEYRLSRFFYMTTEYIQRVQVGGVTATTNSLTDFNVKLKARWEY